jgi:hypothetical protein
MILGHAHISTTMQIYTHVDEEARDDALTGLDKLLGGDQCAGNCGQLRWSRTSLKIIHGTLCLVGATGIEPVTSRL